jgi:high frequency lysogenization protein
MTPNKDFDICLSLAGQLESAWLVDRVANTGQVPRDQLTGMLKSLFVTNPAVTADVYPDLAALCEGARLLNQVMGRQHKQIKADLIRYVIGMMTIERKLVRTPAMLERLDQGLASLRPDWDLTSRDPAPLCAQIAEIYKASISHLSFRIQVTGQPVQLKNPEVSDQVRALLLCGIRSAVLWRQLGGTRLQLIFRPRAQLYSAQQLNQQLNP